MEEVFESLYVRGGWGKGESRSGPGSSMQYTANLRAQLPVFLRRFKVRRFFDAPCGDLH